LECIFIHKKAVIIILLACYYGTELATMMPYSSHNSL
jgi:hypothetical protein